MSETQATPVPINGKFGDDFVTHLVVVMSNDPMTEVAKKIAHHAVGKRIKPRDLPMAVYCDGEIMPASGTVQEVGIEPLQYVFVDYIDAAQG